MWVSVFVHGRMYFNGMFVCLDTSKVSVWYDGLSGVLCVCVWTSEWVDTYVYLSARTPVYPAAFKVYTVHGF